MGNTDTKQDLAGAVKRAEERGGKIGVSGRYHRLPKKIEDDYNLEKRSILGTGYNGAVFMAKSKQNKDPYAVKEFHLTGISKDKMAELKTEAEIFLSMDHPHVARLNAVYENEKKLFIVMECMGGGEVFERVVAKKRFSEKDTAHAVWQMLLAINYIHGKSIVHRDLKLENFLYESKESDHLKLIDFGFSHVWQPNTTMALSCGTLSYVAPEVLESSYTSQCDLWSLGVITFILLSGYMPFSGSESAQIQAIRSGQWSKKPERWAKISKTAQDFRDALLVVDASKRLTAEQAIAHPFIDSHDKEETDIDRGIASALEEYAQASQFRRACMSLMAWSLTNEERAQVRDAFLAIDKNNKGTITLGELKQVLTTKFDIQDAQIKPIFEALDTSQNDEIHYSEFLAAMVSTRIKMHDDMLLTTFKRFDVDNSGQITRENLKAVLGESFDGTQVEKLIAEADTSGDGTISYDEFISYLKNTNSSSQHNLVAGQLIDTEVKKGQNPAELGHDGYLKLQAKPEAKEPVKGSTFTGGADSVSPADSAKGGGAPRDMKGVSTVANKGSTYGGDEKKSKTCILL